MSNCLENRELTHSTLPKEIYTLQIQSVDSRTILDALEELIWNIYLTEHNAPP